MKKLFFFCLFCLMNTLCPAADNNENVTPLSDEVVRVRHSEFLTGAKTYFSQMMEGQEHRYATVMSSVDGYIDFFASQDFATLPDWELSIMDLVKEGRFNEGLDKYEERDLEKEYIEGRLPFDCVERYIMLLQLTGVRQNSMRGIDVLQTIAEKDTATMAPLRVLVGLCLDLRLHNMADEYLNLYQERAKGNAKNTAEVYGWRAMVLSRRNRPNESLVYARRSIAMYDSLANAVNNPSFALLARARVYQSLSRTYYRMENVSASLESIRKCRECYAKESERVSGSCLTERLRTLYNLAPLATDQNAFFLADSLYTEVDELGSWLFEGSEQKQNQFVFNSLRLRGLACYRVGKMDDARELFNKADVILQKLEADAPGQNIENYQNLYFNIASLYYREGDIQKALEVNRVVLSMVLHDKTHDARRHDIDLCYCYKYIGNCLWALAYEKYLGSKQKKNKEVTRLYQEALENFTLAKQHNPRDTEAVAKQNLAQLILSGMEKPMAMPKNF